MNRDATLTRTSRLTAALCRGSLLACSLLVQYPAAAATAPAPPARIDLDAFEAMKKSVALPDGETLAYLTLGDPAGTPVVLVHGYTDSARDWVPLIPYLSPRLRLILVDLRGHGRSGKPDCCYTRLDFAYDIKLLLDALHVERADIVYSHSIGSDSQGFASADYSYQGNSVSLLVGGGGAEVTRAGFGLVNLRFGVDQGDMEYSLNVRNLFSARPNLGDIGYIDYAQFDAGGNVIPQVATLPPLTVMLQVTKSF